MATDNLEPQVTDYAGMLQMFNGEDDASDSVRLVYDMALASIGNRMMERVGEILANGPSVAKVISCTPIRDVLEANGTLTARWQFVMRATYKPEVNPITGNDLVRRIKDMALPGHIDLVALSLPAAGDDYNQVVLIDWAL